MLKKIREMFSTLNTRINQLTGSVNFDRVEDLHNQNELTCLNFQMGLNQLVYNQDCDQVEDLYNLDESRCLKGQTSQHSSCSINTSTQKLDKEERIPLRTRVKLRKRECHVPLFKLILSFQNYMLLGR